MTLSELNEPEDESRMRFVAIGQLVGCSFRQVSIESKNQLVFFLGERSFKMFHEQECCEDVAVIDVAGALSDLENTPIVSASEVSNSSSNEDGTSTWTFYKFRTRKGDVTIAWRGDSNGYYSEGVSIVELDSTGHGGG